MSSSNTPFLQVGRFPRGAVCAVTSSWDDNDSSNMKVKELLDSVRLKGTFYVDPGSRKSDGLTDSQIQTLGASHELGSHTWSHVDVKKCDVKTLRKELIESKAYLEKVSRRTVYGMAYPWGDYSSKSAEMVRECGYLFARTTEEGSTVFPPRNSYTWGISIYAKGPGTPLQRVRSKKVLTWKLLLSRKARLYARYRTGDWRHLALKLFERARRTNGVWHIYGHARDFSETRPETKQQFLEVSRHVALRDDVWYATNSMLFLNEIVKKATSITSNRNGVGNVFKIRANVSNTLTETTPIPLTLSVPNGWAEKFAVDVTANRTGKFEIRRAGKRVWIDIFDCDGTVRVTPE